MIKLNNLTLRFILAATFLLVNCSLFAQSSQNPQSRPAWNNPAIPNTGNPAMVKPSVPAGETLHPHGHTGTQPSDTVKAVLSHRGIMLKKHLQIGVIKGALTQDQADGKLQDWLKAKTAKIEAKRDKLSQSKEATAKARKEAESKIREARAEAIRKKAQVAAEAAAAPPAEGAPAAEAQETQA